jgi:prevent-host-death family protein
MYSIAMTATMSVSEARAALPAVIERVIAGDEVTLTRHGVPVAVVVGPDALVVRRADSALRVAAELRELLDQAGDRPLSTRPGLRSERADELVSDIRAARTKR